MVCPCGNSALPPSSFKDGFLSLIRSPSSSLFCFKISSKKEVGEKSAQGKDGKAVSLLNLFFSHRPICRGTASLFEGLLAYVVKAKRLAVVDVIADLERG